LGLMQAIEFVVDETKQDRTPNTDIVDKLMEETKKRGLLIGRGGLYGNVIRISPAMNANVSVIDEAIQILDDAMAAISN